MSDTQHPWMKSSSTCPDCGEYLMTMVCLDGSCRECLGDLAGYKCQCGWDGDPFDLAEAEQEQSE